jgi:hypothetical protein
MVMKIQISMMAYKHGYYEFILKDPESDEEIILSGDRKFNKDELKFLNHVAPCCVMTQYENDLDE